MAFGDRFRGQSCIFAGAAEAARRLLCIGIEIGLEIHIELRQADCGRAIPTPGFRVRAAHFVDPDPDSDSDLDFESRVFPLLPVVWWVVTVSPP